MPMIEFLIALPIGAVIGWIIREVVSDKLARDRNLEAIKITEFNKAASTFRSKVFTEFVGFYPINQFWEKNEWIRINQSIPIIKSAAAEFRYFVTHKTDFDKAMSEYDKYCREKTQGNVFPLAYPTMGYGGVEERKKEFDNIISHLLSFANEK
jgi:hypothetical protein